MWLEQIIPSLEEKYEDFILFLLTSSHFDEGLAGFRFRIQKVAVAHTDEGKHIHFLHMH